MILRFSILMYVLFLSGCSLLEPKIITKTEYIKVPAKCPVIPFDVPEIPEKDYKVKMVNSKICMSPKEFEELANDFKNTKVNLQKLIDTNSFFNELVTRKNVNVEKMK